MSAKDKLRSLIEDLSRLHESVRIGLTTLANDFAGMRDTYDRIIAALEAFPDTPPVNPPAPPAPTPPPQPPPPPMDHCEMPDGIKLGWRGARKLERGWRNMFDVSPTIRGRAADIACGPYYTMTLGEPQAEQSSLHFAGEPVERASGEGGEYILVIATNNESEWDGDRYKLDGTYEIRVTYPHLKTWRAQTVTMGPDGMIRGGGTNGSNGFDIPK